MTFLYRFKRWWHQASQALEQLARPPATVDELLEQVRSPWPVASWRAARALRSHRDERIVPALRQALRSPWGFVRREALDSLAEIGGEEAIDLLIQVLQRGGGLRPRAARALGQCGDERAAWALCETLEGNYSLSLRSAAAHALGQLWERRAVNPLTAACRDVQALARRLAAQEQCLATTSLARLLEVLPETIRELQGSEAYAQERELRQRVVEVLCREVEASWSVKSTMEAIQALGSLGEAGALPTLKEALAEKPESLPRRQAAVAAMARIVETLASAPELADLEPLLVAWHVPDKRLHEATRKALLNLILELQRAPSADATPRLLQLLGVHDSSLRLRAVQALGQVGDGRALGALEVETHLLSNVTAPEIKVAALEAIAAIESRIGRFSGRELSRAHQTASPGATDLSLSLADQPEEVEEELAEQLTEPVEEEEAGEIQVHRSGNS